MVLRLTRIAILAAAAVTALLGLHGRAASAAEQRPPFLTLEDQRRCIGRTTDECLNWIRQKEFIRSIVQKALVKRGFEQKTAYFIARDWDAFRYNLENGDKILPKPPMLMTGDDAVNFASLIPKCLANMVAFSCQIRFAPEYGCNLQHDYAPACRRAVNKIKASFPAMPITGKTFISWYDSEYNFYNAVACIFGPNGGNIPVFDAGPSASVTKLKFDADSEAGKFTVAMLAQPAAAPVPATPAPAITPAPMCKAVIRASHWRYDLEFVYPDLPIELEAPGLFGGNMARVFRRKGDPPAPANDYAFDDKNSGLPAEIVFDDLSDGWLGMELGGIEDLAASGVSLPRALVRFVTPNGPAAQAGIQKSDYILSIGGRTVDDALYLGLNMTEAPVGQPMSVVYQRGGKSATVTVTAISIDDAARQNDPVALRYLGDFYSSQKATQSVNADNDSDKYYRRAADLGDGLAIDKIATSYLNSNKESDKAQARVWFEKAANAGHVRAMNQLADMYVKGIGGPKDLLLAVAWLEKGAAAGDVQQMYELAQIDLDKDVNKTPEARAWLEKIVTMPNSAQPKDGAPTVGKADFQLGYMKLQGWGGPANVAEGLKLMEAAANSGNAPRAPFIAGIFLITRKDVPPDFAVAKGWFERGAQGENADPNCMWALGVMYKEGEGVPKNSALAMKWLKMAADRGQPDAMKELGVKPAPPQQVITPPPITAHIPPLVTPDMRISKTDPPGPATQGAKSAGKCNPDCADQVIIGTKLATTSVANARACRDFCLATDKCVGWTFTPSVAKNCDLVQTSQDIFGAQGSVTGTVKRGQ